MNWPAEGPGEQQEIAAPTRPEETGGVHSENAAPPKTWILIVGAACLGTGIVFWMVLILLSTFGRQIPVESRFLVVSLLALITASGSGFLGGYVAASGYVPIPAARSHPISFSAVGGVAVFVVVLLIGYWTYSRNSAKAPDDPSLPETASQLVDRLAREIYNSSFEDPDLFKGDDDANVAARQNSVNNILRELPSRGRALAAVPEVDLDLDHKIAKYYWSTVAFVLPAEVSTKQDDQRAYADSGVSAARKAKTLLQEALRGDLPSSSRKFYEDEQMPGRCQYWLTIALAIAVKSGGHGTLVEAKAALEELENEHRELVNSRPVEGNEWLKWLRASNVSTHTTSVPEKEKGGK